MSERTRRYVELMTVAVIAAALSAAMPAIAHGVRHALFAHQAGNADKLGGKPASAYAQKRKLAAPGTINSRGNPIDWTKLKGVPGGFADGSDNIGPGVADDLDCNECVGTADLALGAVTSAKIDDGGVQEDDLGFEVVTQAELAALEARVEELEDTLTAVTYDPGDKLLTVSGANVQIVDGTGATDGVTNGLGNLVIGYNNDNLTGSGQGDNQTDTRTGSHNLVIGDDHTYSSFGGTVAGLNNAISNAHAAVTGGANNIASGFAAAISGGFANTASAAEASVTGGVGNTANFVQSAISGGSSNTATGFAGSVTGGFGNTANGDYATVTGGSSNQASGNGASVTGGNTNLASAPFATATGGHMNSATGNSASVTGGSSNVADNLSEWVGGTLVVRQAQVTVTGAGDTEGNGSYDSAATQVLCGAGEQFLGGGAFWDIDDGTKELNIVYARHISVGTQTGWRVRGGNDTSADHLLTIQAFCLGV